MAADVAAAVSLAERCSEWIAASADGFGLGSAIYKPGMTAKDVGVAAKAIVAAYDVAIS